ncbi:hypothetical protein AKJ47_00575 [candidate division MSBL1 archaeon SCGC-AAA261G05]|uniref:Pyridoxamine 5'-phosphate oxidase N-terminal domain-containing protein n=3 Tax=candidate division MSBL1 TaxID=215777 RepID=A0A133V134_9EURY|nr:hypothetical protein AKJ42_01620 [candidate division MSBL1 archaeon SCGC-AAA261C02]KXB04127.1 hypothetical protein AKJ47_00575 [candidate division MSBL1 archaeon SCGC-AAA261G05]KXB05035.1 hypothetical protein AKJ48_00515 [candidate division MSBL1 archaeon SCGC-AAA261O19]
MQPHDSEGSQESTCGFGSQLFNRRIDNLREGFPITFPVVAFFDESKESIITSTAPAFSQKVDNIEANPKVSILFNASDTVLVKGDGKIHDEDFEENALYGMRLITEEPETPKKSAYMKLVERLNTWYGKLLLDWYKIASGENAGCEVLANSPDIPVSFGLVKNALGERTLNRTYWRATELEWLESRSNPYLETKSMFRSERFDSIFPVGASD